MVNAAPSRADAGDEVAAVWRALGDVPDPEVPAISIVELGIVREVEVTADRVRVAVTPTYSGCPATEMIGTMIRERLREAGVVDVDLVSRLSPPWSTDWMAPEARRKLEAFGIAPPRGTARASAVAIDVTALRARRVARESIPCPHCGSLRTTLLSQFGSTACKSQYRCDECREPFDYFKPH